MKCLNARLSTQQVAPRAGGRGLKFARKRDDWTYDKVAPRAGGRGLKFRDNLLRECDILSPPAQGGVD